MNAVMCFGPDSARFHPIAELLDIESCDISCRTFPDGEVCIRVDINLSGKLCFIVMSCDPPQDRHLQQLYQIVEVAKFQNAGRVICIVPYMAYARQDRRTDIGEPISAQIILNTLKVLGADAFITVDVHNPSIFESSPIPCFNIRTTDAIGKEITRQRLLSDGLIVSPDKGSYPRARDISSRTSIPYIVLQKHKDYCGNTWYEHDNNEIGLILDKKAIVLDDLCSSGSTFIPLAKYLFASGASDVYYFVTHFFAKCSYIYENIGRRVQIVGTNTVKSECTNIDISTEIAKWIMENGNYIFNREG